MPSSRLLAIPLLLCTGIVWAQPSTEPVPAPSDEAPLPADANPAAGPAECHGISGERLLGEWGGARPLLEDHGITIDLGLTTVYQHNARGGVQTRNAHRVSGSYDLELTFDFEALKLWKDGTVYALAEGSWGEGISNRGYVGDLFGVNGDAGGNRPVDLTELWYEHEFFDGRLRVRAGKLDLTVDFETNAFANDETAQFLNNALINSANIPFPDNGHGIQFIATPSDWFYFGAGVADAQAHAHETGFRTTYHGRPDFFSLYEFGLTPRPNTGWGQLPGNYRFGLWYDPQPKDRFFDDLGGRRHTVPQKRDDAGFYASFDQTIVREHPEVEDDEQGLGLFFRYSFAPGDVSETEHFWSAGGQYRGLVPARDSDVLAFGVAQGLLSQKLRLTGADPHQETVLELYYSAPILPWLTIAPDFQWILRPGGEHGRDAFVAGVRLQATF